MEKNKYRGHFIRVTEETIAGSVYERAHFQDTVTVFPVTADGKVLFIKEFRPHEKPRIRWKPVTGFLEKGQSVNQNANRELEEEIGRRADHLTLFFRIKTTGTLNIVQNFIIARSLKISKVPNPDGEDSILGIKALGVREIYRRTMDGEFARGAVGYALLRLCCQVREGKLKL